jgi:hypothetical protein
VEKLTISEEQLKQLVLTILKKLEEEGKREKKLLYMVCSSAWDERYYEFLEEIQKTGEYRVCPVIPDEWQAEGREACFRSFSACEGMRYYSQGIPTDLEDAVTVFPVVATEVAVKTALCIHDTFETTWLAACFRTGSQILFLQSGLIPFSGKEQPAYQEQILSYYRKLLEYGIEIGSFKSLSWSDSVKSVNVKEKTSESGAHGKRLITASNVEEHASDGVLLLKEGDIITDLAKDRARLLNIVLQKT